MWLLFFIIDKKFLAFFFRRLQLNTTKRYTTEFPYVSPCGKETNYVHCDDLPVVFSHLLTPDSKPVEDVASLGSSSDGQEGSDLVLSYGGAGDKLVFPFQPDQLHMLPESGRVYHPGPDKLGGVGLIKSSLAIELSRFFLYATDSNERSSPIGFKWRGVEHQLKHTVLHKLSQLR